MFEINGKYNSCKVFTDNCDNETISQLTNLLNQKSVEGSQIRIMPDTHAGKGCVIGTTMTLHDNVIPNLVGVDVGCFTGDTKVFLSGASWTPIKDLVNRKPFMVDSYDEEQKCFVISPAIARKTRENAELVEVHYAVLSSLSHHEKKYTVRCTPDHKFMLATSEWCEAKDLKTNMFLMADNERVVVNIVRPLDIREDVYCLTVDETHNFLLEGTIVVHNCGMLTIKLKEHDIDLQRLDRCIKQSVPSGFDIHKHAISKSRADKIIAPVDVDKAFKSLGTLGGGNHFIEVDRDSHDNLWLVIHTGSRHLGLEVCSHYQNLAWNKIKNNGINEKITEIVAKLKAEGKEKDIENTIKILRMQTGPVPKDLCYVTGEDFTNYIYDMQLTQKHAAINRQTIADTIINKMGLQPFSTDKYPGEDYFDTIHNYIDCNKMILRKGSVSAEFGERLIIPMNMRDGSLICVGKGNPDWNYSAPHGAGRIMSRSQAKDNVALDDFKESMKGIYSTSVCTSTIDESPFVYKPMQEIIDNVFDTVDILDIIKPIYNFKAH